MKKKMSLINYYKIQNIFGGILWLIVGACFLKDSVVTNAISCVTLLIAMGILIYSMKVKREEEDEMARLHLNEAKSTVLDVILFLSLMVGVVSFVVEDVVINFRCIYYFMLGGIQLLVGILFVYKEKVGK